VRITVVGAGAVGCLLGARLAASGQNVRMIGRPESVEALRRNGIAVEGVAPGRWPVEAGTTVGPAPPPELVLLTVKTFDLIAAARELATALPTPVPTLLPQNGLRVERPVAAVVRERGWRDPAAMLVRAVNSIPAMLLAPGVVRQPGVGELLLPDPSVAGPAARASERWASALGAAGIPVRTVADLELELWRKALVNAAINPVTAIHHVPNGALLEPPYRAEAWTLLREAQQAAALAGVPFTDEAADRALERVLRATADNRSSMLQDVERGRPTEIDEISGEILRTAAEYGVDLPATRNVLGRLGTAAAARGRPAQPS
jgi:2-dehydropantoate 2-reductase